MKNTFWALIVAICLAAAVVLVPATASASNSPTNQYHADLEDFLEQCPSRVSDTPAMTEVAGYLKDRMYQAGVDLVELQSVAGLQYDKNVIASIDVGYDKQTVVIGAHYDTVEAEGANDNACGVITLLQIAKRLVEQKHKLNFNVKLVAFAGEELGLVGAVLIIVLKIVTLTEIKSMLKRGK